MAKKSGRITWEQYQENRDWIRRMRYRRYARWPDGGYMGVRVWGLRKKQRGYLAPVVYDFPRAVFWGTSLNKRAFFEYRPCEGYHAFWPPAVVYHTESVHPLWLWRWILMVFNGLRPWATLPINAPSAGIDIPGVCWGFVEAPVGAIIALHQGGWRASTARPRLLYFQAEKFEEPWTLARELEEAFGCRALPVWSTDSLYKDDSDRLRVAWREVVEKVCDDMR